MSALRGALLLTLFAAPLAAQGTELRGRMADLRRAVDSDQRDRVAAFFPRDGEWSWLRTVRTTPGDSAVGVGRWRFAAADARRAIGAGGPLCESFEPMTAGVGPHEGRLGMRLSLGLRSGREWRHVRASRFVPPGAPDDSPIFVQWRRQGDRWVISSIGDMTWFEPHALGRRAVRPWEVQRALRAVPGTRYVVETEWYQQNTPIVLDGHRYIRYGRPRPLPADSIQRIGLKDGVPVYATPAEANRPGVIYLPTDATHFQVYESPHAYPRACG